MSREENVEPDDAPLVADPVELPVRSPVTAARGPLSMTTELAGPESVPFGGGSGNSGSVGPLTVGTTLRGSSGHLDPTENETPLVQSRVLSDSGDSGPGRVGVGVTAAAAAVVAAAATVRGIVEREESTRHTVERADSPTNHTHTLKDQISHWRQRWLQNPRVCFPIAVLCL